MGRLLVGFARDDEGRFGSPQRVGGHGERPGDGGPRRRRAPGPAGLDMRQMGGADTGGFRQLLHRDAEAQPADPDRVLVQRERVQPIPRKEGLVVRVVRAPDGWRPVARSGEDGEQRRDPGGVYFPQPHLDGKAGERGADGPVHPVEDGPVFGVEPGGEPDRGAAPETHRIGQELAEMAVIGGPELGLDHRQRPGPAVAAYQVGAEPPDRGFPRQRFEVEPERVAETAQIIGHREPGDEIAGLAAPHGCGVDVFETPERPVHRELRFSGGKGCGHEKGRRQFRRPISRPWQIYAKTRPESSNLFIYEQFCRRSFDTRLRRYSG